VNTSGATGTTSGLSKKIFSSDIDTHTTSISHTIAASLPSIPPKSFLTNSPPKHHQNQQHQTYNHHHSISSSVNSKPDSTPPPPSSSLSNGKEKKIDLSAITKGMRHKLPQQQQHVTNSLKEDLLSYSGGGGGGGGGTRVSFQPNTQFTRHSNHHASIGSGDSAIKRHSSLYSKGYLPRSESVLQYDKVATSTAMDSELKTKTRSEIDTTATVASSLSMFETTKLLTNNKKTTSCIIDSKNANNKDNKTASSPQPLTDPILTHIKMKPKQVTASSSIQMREKKNAKLDAAKHRFSQVYERYSHHHHAHNHSHFPLHSHHSTHNQQSNSDCSTIGELKSMTRSVNIKKVNYDLIIGAFKMLDKKYKFNSR